MTDAENALGLRIYQELIANSDSNVVVSPVSIALAMDLAYLGARGRTEAELASVLAAALPRDRFVAAASRQLAHFASLAEAGDIELALANAAYFRDDCSLAGPYGDAVRTSLRSEVFAGIDKDAINRWIAGHTNGKITNLADRLPEEAVFALVNALYLHAAWALPFEPQRTAKRPFHLVGGDRVDVDMMRQVERFGYIEDADVRAVSLPYMGGALRMLLFLPVANDGLGAFEAALDHGRLSELRSRLSRAARVNVALSMPRFKSRYSGDAADSFEAMGIGHAFSASADFSGFCDPPLAVRIAVVLHETVIEVTEAGTEAAAATIVGGEVGSAAPGPTDEPVVFTLDHPFFFVIADSVTGAFVFMGRVTDPLQAE